MKKLISLAVAMFKAMTYAIMMCILLSAIGIENNIVCVIVSGIVGFLTVYHELEIISKIEDLDKTLYNICMLDNKQ